MTKQVRIENADTSHYKVKVRAQHLNAEGEWVDYPSDDKVLSLPTNMTESYITSHRRLIVEETN